MADKPLTKVRDLTPNSKQVNVLAKVISVGEAKEVMGKFGDPRKVCEAVVGDDTATITSRCGTSRSGRSRRTRSSSSTTATSPSFGATCA